MSEIKTPSGQSVTLKDADAITHGDRKLIMSIDEETGQIARGFKLMDNLLTVAITDWSYDLVIPSVKRESLDKLTPADYDAITDAAKPLMDALMPQQAKVDDPKVSPAS